MCDYYVPEFFWIWIYYSDIKADIRITSEGLGQYCCDVQVYHYAGFPPYSLVTKERSIFFNVHMVFLSYTGPPFNILSEGRGVFPLHQPASGTVRGGRLTHNQWQKPVVGAGTRSHVRLKVVRFGYQTCAVTHLATRTPSANFSLCSKNRLQLPMHLCRGMINKND